MASADERSVGQLRLPLQPAKALSERGLERPDPPVSVRCRERGVSGVAGLPRSQDPESADSTKVAMCAVFALLPRSDFPLRQPPRNSAGVVIPLDSQAYEASLSSLPWIP